MRLRARSPRLGDKEHREREERTFDRCLELLKSNPGKLDLVAAKVSEEAKQRPTELMPVTQQLLQEWYEAGLPQARRAGKGAQSVAFRREALRDLLRAHAARVDASTDEAAAHLRREIRRATVQSGMQASTSLAFSQVFVARFVQALHQPRNEDGKPVPGLHEVAIRLCLDLAADLKADANMGREERYKWVKRVLDLQERVAGIIRELAMAEASVAGQDRAELIGAHASQSQGSDPLAGFSDLTVAGLRDHAQGLADALQPLADIERGLAPDLTAKPPN